MTEFQQNGHGSLLDAFLDGTMSDADRTAWLVRLREDVGLRAQVTRQEVIDSALCRVFAPCDETLDRCLARLQTANNRGTHQRKSEPLPSIPQAGTGSQQHRTKSMLALAAAVALCAFAGWQVKEFLFPTAQPSVYAIQKWRSLDRIYADELADGFKPAWVCTNDAEFAKATRRELGQAVVLAQAPGLATLGWSYANTLSTNTLYLLASAADHKVLVFMTPVANTKEPVVEPESGLQLHERVVGNVKLFEVSPQPEPLVIPHFYEPAP